MNTYVDWRPWAPGSWLDSITQHFKIVAFLTDDEEWSATCCGVEIAHSKDMQDFRVQLLQFINAKIALCSP